jgi:hypothetical protein
MTPKEELIQAIERSPDEVVRELLDVLQALQHIHRPNQHSQPKAKDYPASKVF